MAGAVPVSTVNNTEAHFVVARYHANGTLDLSFDGDGIVNLPAGRGSDVGARAVALQPNGRIVVGGAIGNANVSSQFTLVRFNANGALDGSFGMGGIKTVPFSLGVDYDSAQSLALDASGRIVVAGSADEVFGVARLEGDPVAPAVVGAVSRKAHGSAGAFDIALPLTGNPGVECRSGGAGGDYQIVVNFADAISFASASITSGTGSVSSSSGGGYQHGRSKSDRRHQRANLQSPSHKRKQWSEHRRRERPDGCLVRRRERKPNRQRDRHWPDEIAIRAAGERGKFSL